MMIFLHDIKAWIANKLIAQASLWHRLWSIRIMILTSFYTAAAGAWSSGLIPEEWRPQFGHITKLVLAGIGVMLPGIAAVSVVVKQNLPPVQPVITVPTPLPVEKRDGNHNC